MSLSNSVSENCVAEKLTRPSLPGKIALVTGGGRGIGAAIVRALAAEGADAVFSYRSSQAQADRLVKDLDETGRTILPVKTDLASAGAVENLVRTAVKRFGRLDILVNNAAVSAAGRIGTIGPADLDELLAVNVKAPFEAIRCAMPHMREGGRIVNIGSVSSDYMPYVGHAAYVMSKSSLQGMTRGMVRELAELGITINTVQPGRIDTDMLHEVLGSEFDRIRRSTPFKRFGEIADVAELVTFLCGEGAGYISGASLRVDGGVSA